MARKSYPNDVLEQAQAVFSAWMQINSTQAFGTLTPIVLDTELSSAIGVQKQITDLETQLVDLRNRRDAVNANLWSMLKRARSGMKAIYGDDSSQYEMIGGTRMSERKTPTRQTTAA